MQYVKVVWLDSGAHIDHGWAPAEKHWAEGLSREVTTVGMLMQEDDDVIAVGLNFDPDTKNWYGVQLIYKPTVQSRQNLYNDIEAAHEAAILSYGRGEARPFA
jgi:hypothetical protein